MILSTGKVFAVDLTQVFPTKMVTSLGASTVQADLVAIYTAEMKQIAAPLPKILTAEQKATAVSQGVQKRNNQELAQFFQKMPFEKQAQTLTYDDATAVLSSLENHPIVSDAGSAKYDPKRNLGFCFGRAAYVHAELLRRGFDPQSIVKVFAIGKLYFRDSFWDYHMATLARGPGGTWWVIDGLRPKVLNLKDWMNEVAKWDRDAAHPTLRFYFTDPVKFQAVGGGYDSGRMLDPMYNGYFADLARWFLEQPSQKMNLKNQK